MSILAALGEDAELVGGVLKLVEFLQSCLLLGEDFGVAGFDFLEKFDRARNRLRINECGRRLDGCRCCGRRGRCICGLNNDRRKILLAIPRR